MLRNLPNVIIIIVLFILLLGGIGWCLNIKKLAECDFEAPHKTEMLRIIGGIVPPAGALIGYATFEDEKRAKVD